jgi:hypothetical protein
MVYFKGRNGVPQGKELCTSREGVFFYLIENKQLKVWFGGFNSFQHFPISSNNNRGAVIYRATGTTRFTSLLLLLLLS